MRRFQLDKYPTLLKAVPQRKGTKFDLLAFRLQFLGGYQFFKIIEDGSKQKFHQWKLFITSGTLLWNQQNNIQIH